MNQGYTTLDTVVVEACQEVNDNGLHNYSKFMMWAMEGLQEMRIDHFQEIKSVQLTTTTIATLPFPSDMVKWTKIGTVSGDRVKVFTINNSIMLNHKVDCGVEQNNKKYHSSTRIELFDDFGDNPFDNAANAESLDGMWFWGWGNTSGAIYGYGNGTQGDGQFRVNKDMREFQFNSQLADKEVVLEYVSSGLNPSGQSYVEETIRKAVKEYIHWMRIERNDRASLGDKDRAKYLYDMAARTAQRRNLLSLDTIKAIVWKSYGQPPRS